MYGACETRAPFAGTLYKALGGRTIDDEWSVCCCALVNAHQNQLLNNPSASP